MVPARALPCLLLACTAACSLAGLDAYSDGTRDASSSVDASVGEGDARREDSATGKPDHATHDGTAPHDAAPPVAPCDPNEAPSAAGVFVSTAQGNDMSAGGQASPLATISAAMVLAKASHATDVYVDEGVYDELVQPESPLTLHGGWKATVALWKRDCSADVVALTEIRAPSTTAVAITGVTGKVTFEDLTIATSATTAPGASAILVLASGNALALTLTATNLAAGKGGAGAALTTPATPAAPTSCPGVPNSTGATGALGDAGAAAPAGGFTASGYVASNGTGGGPGGPGAHGTVGGAGESLGTSCGSCGSGCTYVAGDGPAVGGTGQGGCGGVAGLPGIAGNSGGASVGVLLAGTGSVLDVAYSSVLAASGGAGSPGSAGGAGGPGSMGTAGYSSFCAGACFEGSGCEESGNTAQGGTPGGTGGTGGAGGAGGGGSGGPSHAIVVLGGAKLTQGTACQLGVELGGPGAGGAPSGSAGSVLELP